MATTLTSKALVQDSYASFSPTAYTSDGGTYVFTQVCDDKFGLYVELTSTTNGTKAKFVIAAGDDALAFQNDLGDLTMTLTSTGTTTPYRAFMGPFASARFIDSDGTIGITITSTAGAGAVGVIGAFNLPYVVYST